MKNKKREVNTTGGTERHREERKRRENTGRKERTKCVRPSITEVA